MKKLLNYAFFGLFLYLLSGCSCDHEWIEATCEEPKTCEKCDKTEGEALGHSIGDWTYEKTNVKYAETTYAKKCENCGEVSDRNTEKIDSFIEDREFEMTAEEFTERLNYKFGSIKENTLMTQEQSLDGDYGCAIGDSSSKEVLGGIIFAAKNEEAITSSQGNTKNISLITGIVYETDDVARVLLGVIVTLDPSLSVSDAIDVGKATTNAARSGDAYTKNGITYMITLSGDSTYILATVKK